jgi:hypothetical protein
LTPKTLITDHGPVEVELPRDREGSFEPQIVPKHQRRFAGFDDKIISGALSARNDAICRSAAAKSSEKGLELSVGALDARLP